MKDLFKNFKYGFSEEEINKSVKNIILSSEKLYSKDNLKKAFSFIDLTFLNCTDNLSMIAEIVNQVNGFKQEFQDMPNVAAICVYPNYVESFAKGMNDKSI